MEKMKLSLKQVRCLDCACLVEGDNGEWICDELNKPCEEVEDCPEGINLQSLAQHWGIPYKKGD